MARRRNPADGDDHSGRRICNRAYMYSHVDEHRREPLYKWGLPDYTYRRLVQRGLILSGTLRKLAFSDASSRSYRSCIRSLYPSCSRRR